jgi:hypothetical protein
MVCACPPEGHARWTVRLVAEQAVRKRLVPRVGRVTIRVLLLSHDLKPWREKSVVWWAKNGPFPCANGGLSLALYGPRSRRWA